MLMEPVIDALKGFANHTQDLLSGLVHRDVDSSRRNPIEILKRLQRESFSDITKLRDRQDKVERLLSFYNISNKSPLEEGSTHVRGEVNVLGGVMKLDEVDEQSHNSLRRAGIRTGIDVRFSFQTNLRKKDLLVAELIASQNAGEYLYGPLVCPPLSLAKVFYKANISETFSAIAIPVGAQCRDVGIGTSSSYQGRGLTDHSSSGPPLANHQHGSGIGITVGKSNTVASLGHFVSGQGIQLRGHEIGHLFSTFGQVICQLPRGIKLTLMGLHQKKMLSNRPISLGPLAIPISLPKRSRDSDVSDPITLAPSIRPWCLSDDHVGPAGSIALTLESDLDESTKFVGWIEMKTSDMNTKTLQWACTVSDNSDDYDLGWGLSLSGSSEGFSVRRFQIEPYLKFKLGKKFTVNPGLVHVTDGDTRFTAYLIRSYWSW